MKDIKFLSPGEKATEQIVNRNNKLTFLEEKGIPGYADKFEKNIMISEFREKYKNLKKETDEIYFLAGRIMQLRVMGRASFANIQDQSGKLQLYFKENELGKSAYKLLKKIDIGDIIGVKGNPFVTNKGELSIRVKKFKILAKCLRPLPEKWHGLTDVELRYRERYLDLFVNPDVRSTFILRSKVIMEIRNFLTNLGFLEVDTPMMQINPGGAAARPFKTFHNALNLELYMRIAPDDCL